MTDVLDLSGPSGFGEMFFDVLEIPQRKLRLCCEKLFQFPLDLLMPFGEALAELKGNPFDFEVTSVLIANLIAELPKVLGQLMVVDVLREFAGAKHLVVLEGLPPFLDWIEGRVKDNTVGVQVRVEGAGCVVGKQGSHDV